MSLFIARVALGFGEGATFPTATRAMQYWTPPSGAASRRADPRLRAARQRGHAAGGRAADRLADLARLLRRAGRRQPGVGRRLGLYFRNEPKEHAAITEASSPTLPPRADAERGRRCRGVRCCGACGR